MCIRDRDYAIRLVMIDSAGRELARTEEPCDICTLKEADEAATRAAGKLMLATRSNPIATAPPPAQPRQAEPAPPATTQRQAEPAPPTPPGTEPVPPSVAARPVEAKH